MILAKSLPVGYRASVRFAFALFAAMAIFLSGIHSGPAEAHEDDPNHAATHHVDKQDDGSATPDAADQHGCHHHCPSVAAPSSKVSDGADDLSSSRYQPGTVMPLTSSPRAPPLTPPKA